MKNKKFDCVEMKRQGAKRVFEKIAKMSKGEELAFWQQRSEELKQLQQTNRSRDSQPNRTTL